MPVDYCAQIARMLSAVLISKTRFACMSVMASLKRVLQLPEPQSVGSVPKGAGA